MDKKSDQIRRDGMRALEEKLGHENALRFLAIVTGNADSRGAKAPAGAKRIEDELAELAAEVPREEWDQLTSDLTEHLDHYVHGTPRE